MTHEDIIKELVAMRDELTVKINENHTPLVNDLEPNEQAWNDGMWEAYRYSRQIISNLLTKIKQQ